MFVIAGPNGAGKSTFHDTVLRAVTTAPFINADVIQRDELQDPSMQAAYQAARIADERRAQALRDGSSFVTETTFSHPSKLDLIREARDAGFRVAVYHINLRSPNLSVLRVAHRVRHGGHPVPEDKIRERYERNQALIREAVQSADYGFVYDNSRLNSPAALSITFKRGQVVTVGDRVPAWARTLYRAELEAFSPARLNPAAASFSDAKETARRIGGDKADVRVAGKSGVYRGPIVGETTMHWLQQVGEKRYVAHFKDALRPGHDDVRSDVRMGQGYVIEHRPDAGVRMAPIPERASAFATLGERDALEKHPELVSAYKTLHAVAEKIAGDASLTDERRKVLVVRARVEIQRRLDAGSTLRPERPAMHRPRRR
ncbi:MAG: zeta toxin family protein [Lautropia sp.]